MDIASISSAYTAIKAIKEIGSTLLNAKIDAEAKQRVSDFVEKGVDRGQREWIAK